MSDDLIEIIKKFKERSVPYKTEKAKIVITINKSPEERSLIKINYDEQNVSKCLIISESEKYLAYNFPFKIERLEDDKKLGEGYSSFKELEEDLMDVDYLDSEAKRIICNGLDYILSNVKHSAS